MELRRALLLFAVVLGLAAIATSFSRPAGRDDDRASDPLPSRSGTATANPRERGSQPALISFSLDRQGRTMRLAAGQPATVTVEVIRPGQVELAGLGLSAAATPLTPARFELFERRAGRYRVRFTPAEGGEARNLGTLRIVR